MNAAQKRKNILAAEAILFGVVFLALVSFMFPYFIREQRAGLLNQIRNDVERIAMAVEAYRLDHKQVPACYSDFRYAGTIPEMEILAGKRITMIPFNLSYWDKITTPLLQNGYLAKSPKSISRLAYHASDPYYVFLFQAERLNESRETVNWGIAVLFPPKEEPSPVKELKPQAIQQNLTGASNVPSLHDLINPNWNNLTVPLIDQDYCYDPSTGLDEGGYIYADSYGHRLPVGLLNEKASMAN